MIQALGGVERILEHTVLWNVLPCLGETVLVCSQSHAILIMMCVVALILSVQFADDLEDRFIN